MTGGWRKASIRAGAVALNGAGKETPQEDSRVQVHHCNTLSFFGGGLRVDCYVSLFTKENGNKLQLEDLGPPEFLESGSTYEGTFCCRQHDEDVRLQCGETFDFHHLRLSQEPSEPPVILQYKNTFHFSS